MGSEQLTAEEIAKIIDPDDTFLDECQGAVDFMIKCKTSEKIPNGK